MTVDEGTRLLVARHGETEDNAAARWQGWNDSALSPRGLAQATALARRLAEEPLAAVYCSDLGRARTTARIAAMRHDLAPRPDPALRERDVGLFSGLTLSEVEARYPDALERRAVDGVLDWAPPDGESFRQVLARVLPALDAIAGLYAGRTVLVVTHGGVIRVLTAYALEGDWAHAYERHPSNCGLSHFTWHGAGRLRLDQFDEKVNAA